MRRISPILIAGLIFITACNRANKPTTENLAKAINHYFEEHGRACTSIGREFPIDIPASTRQAQYGFGPQLAALQQAGLVSETDTTAIVHGMLDALRGSTPPQRVKRYQLNDEGQKYFRQIPGTFGQTGGLCYGQKTVGSILKWSDPVTIDGSSQIEVTYTYKLVHLAPWAAQPAIQQAFPDIGATVNGALRTSNTVGIQLTNSGWQIGGP